MVITPGDMRSLTTVFLAGTIDMGNSVDWQAEVIKMIDCPELRIANPRRVVALEAIEDIDFQIRWELYHIKKSDAIFMYFAPGSKSPITLLELGLVLGMPDKKIVIVCSRGFDRYQNVRMTVEEFKHPNLRFSDSLHGGVEDFRSMIRVCK